ncbi:hypothetical protein HYDPIDRAFT_123951 [Hydnomerulius pinastri MD-312]|nr:hypothetical protein HYDPIDRAFT_123951 [Hydnomerulius pinastri MD-312]
MHPFYAPAAPHGYVAPVHQHQGAHYAPNSVAAHHAVAPSTPQRAEVDIQAQEMYQAGNARLYQAINQELSGREREQCVEHIKYARVHRNLIMHTYVHLVFCDRRQGLLSDLREYIRRWSSLTSLQQLTHQSKIRDTLFNLLLSSVQCQRHNHLYKHKHSVLPEDRIDLLCHLIHCGRSYETDFYQLPGKHAIVENDHRWKESEQVIELLAMYLRDRDLSDNITRRLRSHIYRMSRKSNYLPRALRIQREDVRVVEDNAAFGAVSVISRGTCGTLQVAIKKIAFSDHNELQGFRKAFASEAILWSTLRHPRIVEFRGVIVDRTGLNISLVSTFMKHGNVRGYLQNHPNTNIWPLGKDIAEALAFIHGLEPPIYHGDVKGDNILIDDSGHARLGDFGQAFAADSRKFFDSSRVGLPNSPYPWLAPELMEGDDHVKITSMTDMYAFGSVLYEMAAGMHPFQGYAPLEIYKQVMGSHLPERPRSLRSDDPIWRIMVHCWAKTPQSRLTASQVVTRLGQHH